MNDRHIQNGDATSRDEGRRALLTAYALGQLEGEELQQFEAELRSAEGADLRKEAEQIRRLGGAVKDASAVEEKAAASPELRSAVLRCLDTEKSGPATSSDTRQVDLADRSPSRRSRWLPVALVGGLLSLLVAVLALPRLQDTLAHRSVTTLPVEQNIDAVKQETFTASAPPSTTAPQGSPPVVYAPQPAVSAGSGRHPFGDEPAPGYAGALPGLAEAAPGGTEAQFAEFGGANGPAVADPKPAALGLEVRGESERGGVALTDSLSTTADPKALAVRPRILVQEEQKGLAPTDAYGVSPPRQREASLAQVQRQLSEGEVVDAGGARFYYRALEERNADLDGTTQLYSLAPSNEQYDPIVENAFLSPAEQPLSTFSIDVDTASYANVRRFLMSGRLPPPNAVRLEELVNYFRYDYPQPKEGEPFSVNLEMAECPWREGHRLLRVGLQGKDVHRGERPQSNLVFLLDVSGSMDEPNKLPLVKQSLSMLVQELTENDRVSIVTYAGNAGLVLPPTSGDQKQKILASIESLAPGGSTHGSAGIQLAYDLAKEYFRKEGTNRVILATDGDLNVGVTSDEALVELIKEKAQGGTFLTVLGFGEGNLKDSKMEKLADNGNGIYAYIDGAREGRKVLVEQMTGSLITIAKDVKIQIEFNPAEVASYRLLGYENRILAAQDFNNDKKDAGEIGAGHSVTALYEIVPVGAKTAVEKAKDELPGTDPLKYQASGKGQTTGESATEKPAVTDEQLTEAAKSGELLTLKLRYKEPDGDTSKLLEYPLAEKGGSFNSASKEMQFASAVASFGMVLRQSEHRGTSNLAAVEEIATGATGKDDGGYRAEFVDLVKRSATMGIK